MSIGNKVTLNCRESFSGYACRGGGGASLLVPLDAFDDEGGIVELGFGEESAYTLAAAILSANVLNSATGVTWFRMFSAILNGVDGALVRRYGGAGGDGGLIGGGEDHTLPE